MKYYTNGKIVMGLQPDNDKLIVCFLAKDAKRHAVYMNAVQVWEYIEVNEYSEAGDDEIAKHLLQTLH